MARFKRIDVLCNMIHTGVVPVFYNSNAETAKSIVLACAEGGAKVVEFTNRGDHAVDVFSQLTRYFAAEKPDVILGVGSIVDAPTAAMYIACGANFIVGPTLNEEVARLCNRRKIAYCPGCGSVTEISRAEELGAEIVKVFPGQQVGGPDFVKMVLGPCPWTSIMPTGGVEATRESIEAWFKAGIVCAGMGSNLISRDLVAAKDFKAITQRVKQVVGWIDEVRK